MPKRKTSPVRKHPRKTESRRARIDATLTYADKQLRDISRSYDAQLRHEQVPLELCLKIKNFCENLRSALDFVAFEIFEHCYPGTAAPVELGFPLLWKRPRNKATKSINSAFQT